MGCCVSTHGSASASASQKHHLPKSTQESRAPPPSFDEETVKEVLSEIPKAKPSLLPLSPPPTIKNRIPENQHLHNIISQEPIFPDGNIEEYGYNNNEKNVLPEEEISELQVSEVCSLSLSETVSTTTINNGARDNHDDDDDDGEVKQRVMMTSPAAKLPPNNRAFRGDSGTKQDRRFVGKSPSRRSEQYSPGKRNNAGGGRGTVRMVQSRGSGRTRSDPSPNRKDPGENSGRRSRSPATNRSVTMGRSPNAKMSNQSPGRVRKDPTENGGGGVEESLENPMVSLECFIFL